MLVEVLNSGIVLTVPPVVVTLDDVLAILCDGAASGVVPAVDVAPADAGGAAKTNADAGSPPSVCASAAFIAYGTATSSTRGCSSPPFTVRASQRASPVVNRSTGIPSGLVDPSCAV